MALVTMTSHSIDSTTDKGDTFLSFYAMFADGHEVDIAMPNAEMKDGINGLVINQRGQRVVAETMTDADQFDLFLADRADGELILLAGQGSGIPAMFSDAAKETMKTLGSDELETLADGIGYTFAGVFNVPEIGKDELSAGIDGFIHKEFDFAD